MATQEKPVGAIASEPVPVAIEGGKAGPEPVPVPVPPETFVSVSEGNYYRASDLVLRILLSLTTLAALLLAVTSKETKLIPVPGLPNTIRVLPMEAKFQNSPALIFYVVALSVAVLYGIVSALASLTALWKPPLSLKIVFHLALVDALMLGVVASALGAAGGVSYVGFKGNSHVNWSKICNVYSKFCRYGAASLFITLVASIILVLLLVLSSISLHSRLSRAG